MAATPNKPRGRATNTKRSGTLSSNRKTWKTTTSSRTQYNYMRDDFQRKIKSYRTLCNQTQGSSGATLPTPRTLNSFANWINKGALLHTVSPTQLNRWSNSKQKCSTIHAAKSVLWSKFGKAPIKAVCKTKTGSFLVATVPTYQGKEFKFPR